MVQVSGLRDLYNPFPLILKAPPPNIRTGFRGRGFILGGVSGHPGMSRIDSNSSVQSDKSTASRQPTCQPLIDAAKTGKGGR